MYFTTYMILSIISIIISINIVYSNLSNKPIHQINNSTNLNNKNCILEDWSKDKSFNKFLLLSSYFKDFDIISTINNKKSIVENVYETNEYQFYFSESIKKESIRKEKLNKNNVEIQLIAKKISFITLPEIITFQPLQPIIPSSNLMILGNISNVTLRVDFDLQYAEKRPKRNFFQNIYDFFVSFFKNNKNKKDNLNEIDYHGLLSLDIQIPAIYNYQIGLEAKMIDISKNLFKKMFYGAKYYSKLFMNSHRHVNPIRDIIKDTVDNLYVSNVQFNGESKEFLQSTAELIIADHMLYIEITPNSTISNNVNDCINDEMYEILLDQLQFRQFLIDGIQNILFNSGNFIISNALKDNVFNGRC